MFLDIYRNRRRLKYFYIIIIQREITEKKIGISAFEYEIRTRKIVSFFSCVVAAVPLIFVSKFIFSSLSLSAQNSSDIDKMKKKEHDFFRCKKLIVYPENGKDEATKSK